MAQRHEHTEHVLGFLVSSWSEKVVEVSRDTRIHRGSSGFAREHQFYPRVIYRKIWRKGM